MFGKKNCGHESSSPFRVKCSKTAGHSGHHSAKGLRWGADGKIKFGGKGKTGRAGGR